MTMSEEFLRFEIDQILYLQNHFKPIEPYFAALRRQFSPINIQFVLAPLISSFAGESLVETIFTLAASDYVAQMLKWIIGESRPFWWIRESTIYTIKRPQLRHHPLTCSTSGGSPSGHANIVTVLLYMLGRKLINRVQMKTNISRNICSCIIFALIFIIIGNIWISGAYFGTNFIHQGLAGTTLALVTIHVLEQEEIKNTILSIGKRKAVSFVALAGIAMGGVFVTMLQMDVDPMWSVRMAFKWCESVDFLNPETTPIYSIIRNLGSLFGIALCTPLNRKLAFSSNKWKSIPLNIGLIALNVFLMAKTPKDSGKVSFLLWTFLVSAFHSYGLIDLVPRIVNWTQDKSLVK